MNQIRPTVDPLLFRQVMSRFASGVTIVAVRRADGGVQAMTANAFMSGSLEPPLCVVCIAKRAQMHPHMSAAGQFSVNVLGRGEENYSNHFAGRPVPGLAVSFGDNAGVPVLGEAIARITAARVAIHDCGDHDLFVGHIMTMEAGAGEPLIYYASRYGSFLPAPEQPDEVGPFW